MNYFKLGLWHLLKGMQGLICIEKLWMVKSGLGVYTINNL